MRPPSKSASALYVPVTGRLWHKSDREVVTLVPLVFGSTGRADLQSWLLPDVLDQAIQQKSLKKSAEFSCHPVQERFRHVLASLVSKVSIIQNCRVRIDLKCYYPTARPACEINPPVVDP